MLVLDAYENLGDLTERIDDDLLRLLEGAPNVRAVITSRAPTTLTSPAVVLRHGISVLTEHLLAFTLEETESFWGTNSTRGVSPAQVHRETRGFPLAIRALRLAHLRHDALPQVAADSWRGYVAEYLREQLDRSGAHEFVLDICVAPYLDQELADTLSGFDAHGVLAQLEWNGFGRWIPYAPGRPVFQYIDLVRDSYVAELGRSDAVRFGTKANAAARWLHANDEHEAAFTLALDADQYALAERIYRDLAVARPEIYMTDVLAARLGRLPRSILVERPVLAFALAVVLISSVATRGAAPELFQATVDRTKRLNPRATPAHKLFHQLVRTLSQRALQQFRDAADSAAQGYALFEGLTVEQLDTLGELAPTALRQYAYSLLQDGRTEESRQVVDQAISHAHTPWSRNYTLVYGVGIHAIEGRRRAAAAASALVDPDSWPRDTSSSYMSALGRVGEGALLLDDFDFEGALAQFENCESFLDTADYWPFVNWVIAHARIGLGEATTEAVRLAEALRAQPPAPGTGDNVGTAALLNTLSIAWLIAGNGTRAGEVLRQPMGCCAGQLAPARLLARLMSGESERALLDLPRLESLHGHTVRSSAATLTLASVAALHTGREEVAAEILGRAAALHRTHGARAHLLYVPAPALEELRALAADLGQAAILDYLTAPVPAVFDRTPTADHRVALSRREQIVLNAIVQYRTRAEIAAALHVSEATVKTQLHSLYRKLDVTTRKAAIERAIERDLFSRELRID